MEIRSGGVGKDGIPALDHVEMIAVADANIPATEPVITLELAGLAPRAYLLRYMTWHEIDLLCGCYFCFLRLFF